jgi:MHS family proline/betaine transporter-like MFS transporter
MKRASIFAAITGNILEWYDFTLYVFLAPVIAQNFFPQQDHLTALLSTFLIFALGFFIRPLGSLLFGHLGDRYGRTTTLKLSLLLISLPTMGLAFLPPYSVSGIYSALALVFFRLVQGLCIGGEFAGSMIYLSEMAAAHKRALTSCMTNNGSNAGVLAATLSAAFFSSLMTEADFSQYGWRLPFLLGGILGLVGLWFRQDLSETPVFKHLQAEAKVAGLPLLTVLRFHKKAVSHIFLLLVMAATGSYVLMDFMSSYLHNYFHYSLAAALKIQAIYNALSFLGVTLAAYYADHYGRRFTLLAAACGYLVFSLPCFYLLKIEGSWLWLLPLVIFYCMEEAATPATMAELFPAEARYTGISLGYNLAMALVGGTAPLLTTWLVAKFNNPLIIAYYLAAGALVSLGVIVVSLQRQFGYACDLAS